MFRLMTSAILRLTRSRVSRTDLLCCQSPAYDTCWTTARDVLGCAFIPTLNRHRHPPGICSLRVSLLKPSRWLCGCNALKERICFGTRVQLIRARPQTYFYVLSVLGVVLGGAYRCQDLVASRLLSAGNASTRFCPLRSNQ